MSATAIILTIAAYIALLFIVAHLSARHSDNRTFFTGGRNTHRIVAAIAMVGAAMSGVTYISVPGSVLTDHFSYLQTTLGFFVGYLIISFVLVPLYYRLGVVSLYEYLDRRFGIAAHRTGAWFFVISKLLSASLRAYVVCIVLQSLLFDRYDIPFEVNAFVMMSLVGLYTWRGGVKTVVWTEMLKTILMVGSIVICIVFIISNLDMSFGDAMGAIANHDYSETLFLDDPMDGRYFWKQFLAGIFLVVAMTGLDQDMMQTALSCRNVKESQRGLLLSIVVQMFVILLFLALGVLFYIYLSSRGIVPAADGGFPLIDASGEAVVVRGDDLFGYVTTEAGLPLMAGIIFLLGLVASTYSSAGSALTALTTSFTLDILRGRKTWSEVKIARTRRMAHLLIAATMMLIIITFGKWSSMGVITLVFTMASYTYGPLLGMFAFGLTTKRRVRGWAIPTLAVAVPTLCYVLASHSEEWLAGYSFSYEILIVNAAIMFVGMWIFSRRNVA